MFKTFLLDFVHHFCFILYENQNVSEISSISRQREYVVKLTSGTQSVRTDTP